MSRDFRQVDVFTTAEYQGNPVAVVHGADGLTDEQMQQFANWTNLSETTFLLEPAAAGADYRVRIFMPGSELPFAGHPTLGSCHAWLEAGGQPARDDVVVQECKAGLITLRRTGAGLAFAAPPLVRSGPVDAPLAERVAAMLNLAPADIVDLQWADNGPGWVAVLLDSAAAVLAVRPGHPGPRPEPRHRRPVPGRVAGGAGGPGVLPQGRRDHRGSRDRQPECLPGAVADRPAGSARRMSPARAPSWAAAAG